MTSAENNQEKVDQILLGEGSLQELKAFFPNPEAILNCHAQRMAELFPPDKNTNECECCQRHPSEFHVTFLWRGIYYMAGTFVGTLLIGLVTAMAGHAVIPNRHIIFSTTHGLCSDCFKQIRLRRMLGKIMEKLCLVLIVIGAIIFVPLLIATPVLLFSKPTSHEITIMVAGLAGGLICLMAGLFGADKVIRWCIPKSLKFISKRPFQLVGFQKR